MARFKILILWVMALQMLNTSLYSDSCSFYFNNGPIQVSEKSADPTETIVEWLVELNAGQMDVFTLHQPDTNTGNSIKSISFHFDLQTHHEDYKILRKFVKRYYYTPHFRLSLASFDILSPPPEYSC